MSAVIAVLPYDTRWPEWFDTIRADLCAGLADVSSARVEHVGSTAVPGMAAKPIIDVDVLVAPSDMALAIRAMELLGYEHKGELGIPDRHAFMAPDDDPERHVYVVAEGSLAARNHLGVREVLRSNRELRTRYTALKTKLARHHDSRTEYMIAKTELIHEILDTAGLSAEERVEIDAHTSRTTPLVREISG